MSGRKRPSLPLMRIQGPGLIKYDLSAVPPKLRRSSDVTAASRSNKRNRDPHMETFEGPVDTEDVTFPQSSVSFSIPVEDQIPLYTLGVKDSGYFCPCDVNMTVFAIADYDMSSKDIKKHNILTVRRKTVNFMEDSVTKWIYCCSCNLVFADYVDALAANVQTSSNDFEEKYCIHIEVVKQLTADDDVIQPNINQTDHAYSSVTSDNDEKGLLELPFGNDLCLANCGVMPGVVTVSSCKAQCYTCHDTGFCCHKKFLVSQLDAGDTETTSDCVCRLRSLLDNHENKKMTFVYSTWSKKPIKFRLSEDMRESFLKPFPNCISEDGTFQLFPFENDNCDVCLNHIESRCDLQGRTTIPFFSRYEVYDVSVYSRRCSCGNSQMFDGCELSVLNMKTFLIHHNLLRDYMWHFLYARCTLYSYFNVWMEEMLDLGIDLVSKGMSYVKFRHSWYAYLSLLDINFNEGFQCKKCNSSPSVIICDATSLSFRKSFTTWNMTKEFTTDGNCSLIKGSRYQDRMLINKKKVRVLLLSYCNGLDKMTEDQFHSMSRDVVSCFPSVEPLLQTLGNLGCFMSCPPEHRPLLEMVASSSPACALLPWTTDNESIVNALSDLDMNADIAENSALLANIQQRLPLIFEIIKAVGSKLSPEYMQIFRDILAKSKATFQVSVCENSLPSDNEQDINDKTAFFPALPIVRSRGKFKSDRNKESYEKCSKDSTRHPTLLPGIFTVFCEHGVCYGFQIMENNESPNVPFSFIRTRFSRAPATIIYDNACNLHSYFLNRDPSFIQATTFAVDNLHWRNHKACSKVYHARNHPALVGINTQMVEQNNAKLRKLKSQLSYMNYDNFMAHLKFFLWHCNKKVVDKF